MRNLHFFISFIGSISLVMFICSFSIFCTANTKWIYHRDIATLNLSESGNLSSEEIKQTFDELIYYINHKEPEELKLTSFPVSPEGSIHFKDTKDLFLMNKFLLCISAISVAVFLYIHYKNKDVSFLKYGSFGCLILLSCILIGALINFDSAFTVFHKILFSNDYWLFSPSLDPVITILPQEFFFHCFIFICVLIVALSLIFIFISNILKRYIDKNRGSSYN